jgi:hypothetical protein
LGSGLFGTHGTLIDLSPSSARLQLAKAPKLETTLRIQLGRELTEGRPLKLKTTVVRRRELPDKSGYEVGLSILDARSKRVAIQSILDHFSSGPAPWVSDPTEGQSAVESAAATDSPDPEIASAPPKRPAPPRLQSHLPHTQARTAARPPRTNRAASLTGSRDTHETLESNAREIETQEVEHTERRTEIRIPYHDRVMALDEEAARVLRGRDLSMSGMHIVSNATVPIGSLVRIALHAGTGMESLVLLSRAIRNDGQDGMVLTFENLDPFQREQLEKIIGGTCQIRETGDSDRACSEGEECLVIGELLEEIDGDDTS